MSLNRRRLCIFSGGPPLHPRILFAIALVGLLSAGLVAATLTSSEDRPGPERVAWPRADDRSTYEVHAYGTDRQASFDERWSMTFRWNGPHDDVDGYGRPETLERAEGVITRPGTEVGEGLLRFGFRNVTLSPVVTTIDWVHEATVSQGPGPLETERFAVTQHVNETWRERPLAPLSCLLRAGWQGADPDSLAGRPYEDVCPGVTARHSRHLALFSGQGSLPAPGFDVASAITGIGWETKGGLKAYHLRILHEAEDVPARKYTAAAADQFTYTVAHDWWLAPGIAYPVGFTETVTWMRGPSPPDPENGGETTVEMTLVGLEAGGDRILLGPPAEVKPGRRADLEWAPLGADGPAPGVGPTLPFPLAEAVAAVQADLHPEGPAAWLRAHPEARVASGFYCPCGSLAWDTGAPGWAGTDDRVWDLVFVDPSGAAISVAVLRSEDAKAEDVRIGLPVNPTRIAYWWEDKLEPYNDVITDFPTIGSVIALRSAHTRETTPNITHVYFDALYGEERMSVGLGTYIDPWSSATGEWALDASSITVAATDGHLDATSYMLLDGEHTYTPRLDDVLSSPASAQAPLDPGRQKANGLNIAALAAGPLLVVVLFTYLFPLLKHLTAQAWVAVAGHAKISRSAVLDHPTREAIHGLVREEPGISAPELSMRVGCSYTATVHHLTTLQRNGLVTSETDGRHKRFFLTGLGLAERQRLTALKNERTRSLYDAVRHSPHASLEQHAQQVGISRPGLYFHVRRLEHAGLVSRRRDGRRQRLVPLDV